MFIGREIELSYFEDKYNTPGGQLVVLYGRRRIGKTEILHRFSEGKPCVFYSCRELSDTKQHSAFMERMIKAGIPTPKYPGTYVDWESSFGSILDLPSNGKKKLLIIDEFPYMCKGNNSIPSILQILWDESLKNQNVMIVLCGSAMSFIEKEVLSEKNPLYGRTTGIFKLNDLPYNDAIKFFSDYSDEEKMLTYAVLGGIPHYLKQFDPTISLEKNIIKNVLTKGSVLYNEVEFLIRQELREPAFYNTLIEAIALGNTQLNDIHMKTQIDKAKISVYLKNLIELQILKRDFSVLSSEKEQATSTRGLYRITDNYFRFWFSFVFANLSDLENNDAEGVYNYAVLPHLNNFASPVFEAVCLEFIRNKNRNGELPFRIYKSGSWWGKLNKTVKTSEGVTKKISEESEIDIVAFDKSSGNYILGECKFRNSEMDVEIIAQLTEKSSIAKKDATINYMLFSKSGFTQKLIDLAKNNNNLKLFSLSDVLKY